MNRARAPGAAQEQSRRVMQHLLGSGDLRVILAAVALLVSLGWFSDSLFELLGDLDAAWQGLPVVNWWPPSRLIALFVFPCLLLTLSLLAAGARRRYRPRVGVDEQPGQVRGLILFLSNLKPDDEASLSAGLGQLDSLEHFYTHYGRLNWRMPIEAIAYHRPRLREVVLICSRGERRANGQTTAGSIEQLGLFRNVVRALFPAIEPGNETGSELRLRDMTELDSRYCGGLSFEDVDAVSRATDDALANLLSSGLSLNDVLIDVTGGQKPNTVAATAVALAEGRRIQYVTNDYRVIVYDVTYDR